MEVEKVCRRSGCRMAGTPQPIGNFSRDSTRPDGFHPYCNECRREQKRAYNDRPEVKERAREHGRKYDASDRGRERRREYHVAHMDAHREKTRRYRQTPEGKAKVREQRARYRERNQAKECARMAVYQAIKNGAVIVPDCCEWCGKPAAGDTLEGHHWLGYSPEHWLSVKFVHARPCHLECETAPPEAWP